MPEIATHSKNPGPKESLAKRLEEVLKAHLDGLVAHEIAEAYLLLSHNQHLRGAA